LGYEGETIGDNPKFKPQGAVPVTTLHKVFDRRKALRQNRARERKDNNKKELEEGGAGG